MKIPEICLQSRPITDLEITIEVQYVKQVHHYLESLGCSVSMREKNRYHIQLPTGTTEETYAGQSTPWTHKSNVLFPEGQKLTKYIVTSPNFRKSTTMLAFPESVIPTKNENTSNKQK